jgi:hypothetical protein
MMIRMRMGMRMGKRKPDTGDRGLVLEFHIIEVERRVPVIGAFHESLPLEHAMRTCQK